jgi:hypothetical protein
MRRESDPTAMIGLVILVLAAVALILSLAWLAA